MANGDREREIKVNVVQTAKVLFAARTDYEKDKLLRRVNEKRCDSKAKTKDR